VVIYQAAPQPQQKRSPSTGSSTTPDFVPKRNGSSSSECSTGSETLSSGTIASNSSSPLLQNINCVPQNRLQAVSVAMSKLIPAGEPVETALDLMNIAPFYFMQIRQPVLVAAMDTLALVQLGTSYKDHGVLVQAQRSYGKCLLLLLQTISSMPKGVEWDEQIASAVLVIALAGVSRLDMITVLSTDLTTRHSTYYIKLKTWSGTVSGCGSFWRAVDLSHWRLDSRLQSSIKQDRSWQVPGQSQCGEFANSTSDLSQWQLATEVLSGGARMDGGLKVRTWAR